MEINKKTKAAVLKVNGQKQMFLTRANSPISVYVILIIHLGPQHSVFLQQNQVLEQVVFHACTLAVHHQPCAAEQSLSSGAGWQCCAESQEQSFQRGPGCDAAGLRRRHRHLQVLLQLVRRRC